MDTRNGVARIGERRASDKARADVLTEAEYASPLGKRIYDLRHACLSYPARSVDVLLKIYAKCVADQDEIAKRRISEALDETEDPPGTSARSAANDR